MNLLEMIYLISQFSTSYVIFDHFFYLKIEEFENIDLYQNNHDNHLHIECLCLYFRL